MADDADPRGRALSELVAEAMRLRPDERLGFLRARCGDDASLLASAEELLRATEAIASHLARGGAATKQAPLPRVDHGAGRLKPGTRIGTYIIVQDLGAGSFGDVYLAESTKHPRQPVALKVLRSGVASLEDFSRFAQEAQALALLSHSCIARFYDADTANGHEYIAMEYVKGSPITDSCDQSSRGLTERLELVIRICGAVQHAHQAAIIHRDLKPANILVADEDGVAVPKVIDFGVAKLLNQPLAGRAHVSEFGRVIGTPAYMPPEQADGRREGVGTRSDIYSLGVLLHELLTGTLPFDLSSCSLEEMRRVICETAPTRPSRRFAELLEKDPARAEQIARQRGLSPRELIAKLSGDLDWIILCCLEKDPARRYSAADRLADDLRRHLALQPIEARKPSAAYRARLFVRRHRGAVAIAAIAGVILAGAVVKITALQVANAYLEKAERRRQAVEVLEDGRLMLLAATWEFRPDVDEAPVVAKDNAEGRRAAREILERATKLDPDLIEAQILLAHATHFDGDHDAALRQAREIERRFPSSTDAKALRSALEGDTAAPLIGPPRREDAPAHPDRDLYHRALALEDPERTIPMLELACAENPWYFDARALLAARRRDAGDFEGMLTDAWLLTRARPDLALAWSLQGSALYGLRRHSDAVAAFTRALEIESRIDTGTGKPSPTAWRTLYDRALALHPLRMWDAEVADLNRAAELAPDVPRIIALRGAVAQKRENWSAAIADYSRAIELDAADAWVVQSRGETFRRAGEPERALADLDRALTLADKEQDPAEMRARVLRSRGTTLLGLGRVDEAIRDLQDACALRPALAWGHAQLARALFRAGRPQEALRSYDEAIRRGQSAETGYERAVMEWFAGRPDLARPALERWAGVPGYHWIHLWLWDFESCRGDSDGAARALAAARAACPASDPDFSLVIGVIDGRKPESAANLDAMSPASRLYSCYILGARAALAGRRDDAIALYERGLALKQLEDFEKDIIGHHLHALREGSVP